MLGREAASVIVALLVLTNNVCSWSLDNVKVAQRRSFPLDIDSLALSQRNVAQEDEKPDGYRNWLEEQVELERRADEELQAAEIAAAEEEYERIKYNIELEERDLNRPKSRRSSTVSNDNVQNAEVQNSPKKLEKKHVAGSQEKGAPMGVANYSCDDAQHRLEVDWDPADPASADNYTCDSSILHPTHQTYTVECVEPKKPTHICMGSVLQKQSEPPVSGNHRPLWAKFGTYKFLPWQRWLHNLEHGAIGLLYHKCADPAEVAKAQDVLVNCMRKHIATPYDLPPDKPLALVSWGCYLYLTHFDKDIVFNFIKQHAMKGRENSFTMDGQYDKMIDRPAEIVSDLRESEICPESNFPEMYEKENEANEQEQQKQSEGKNASEASRTELRKLERRDASWMEDPEMGLVEGNMIPELESEAAIARLEREEEKSDLDREKEIAELEKEEEIARLDREADVMHLEKDLDTVKKLFRQKVKPFMHDKTMA